MKALYSLLTVLILSISSPAADGPKFTPSSVPGCKGGRCHKKAAPIRSVVPGTYQPTPRVIRRGCGKPIRIK